MSLPTSVNAIVYTAAGGDEVIKKITIPFPQQKPDEVVVKIVYGAVNSLDAYLRKGLYPVPGYPQVSGVEASGYIVSLPTDQNVLNDKWYKLRGYKVGGKALIGGFGTFAEYVSLPWKWIFPAPETLPFDIGAAATNHALTAVTFMTEAYNVQKGDIIFIHTVAGSLGLLFTAYAKSRGATVIGTTSTPEKAELAKSYGADHVILYTKENLAERVKEITNGEGVHAVFDGVGKDTFAADLEILRRKGTLVVSGMASGAPDPISPLQLGAKNLKLVNPAMAGYIATSEEAQRYIQEVFQCLESGLFKTRIFAVYPFTAEAVRKAQKEITTPGGKLAGKLLIKVSSE